MKIEKVNERQIRCTLTQEDLAQRELKISELAYGSEKAKNLFRDMMEQASYECGFEAEDIPLMIEAIPMSSECVVLIITKVDSPDELDTRFAKFLGSEVAESDALDEVLNNLSERDDDVLDLFRKIQETHSVKAKSDNSIKSMKEAAAKRNEDEWIQVSVMYAFQNLTSVIKVAHMAKDLFTGQNTLYKDNLHHEYLLVVSNDENSNASFNKVCNMLSEYAALKKYLNYSSEYAEEHFTPIIKDNALQVLSAI